MFCVKGTSSCYCEECAKDNFSDLDLLQKVEDWAQELKQAIKEEIENAASEEKEEDEQYDDE